MIRTVTGIVDGFYPRVQRIISKEEIIRRQEEILQNAKDGIYDKVEGYSSYVRYMEDILGARREHFVLTEKHTKLVYLQDLDKGKSGWVVDIRCPSGMIMSICGIEDTKDDENPFGIGLKLTDADDKEVDKFTKIKMDKMNITDRISNINRIFYYDVNMIDNDIRPYKFKQSIILFGTDNLRISVTGIDNPCGDLSYNGHSIISENIKLSMDVDLWYL